jgi:uncharacterized alpha-E superfamily protein
MNNNLEWLKVCNHCKRRETEMDKEHKSALIPVAMPEIFKNIQPKLYCSTCLEIITSQIVNSEKNTEEVEKAITMVAGYMVMDHSFKKSLLEVLEKINEKLNSIHDDIN